MLKIKDYLVLKKIYTYLDNKRDEYLRENNGFSNDVIDELTILVNGLWNIIEELEEE